MSENSKELKQSTDAHLGISVVSNRTCENCFYRTYNTTSIFEHDKYYCTAGRYETTITNIKIHSCNRWMEI
jgi:hypothetical protein